MFPPHGRFTLTIQALLDAALAVIRLRRVIKPLLRSYGFRLLAAVQLPEDAKTPRHEEGGAVWVGWFRVRDGSPWQRACDAPTLEECSCKETAATNGGRIKNNPT